MNLLLQLTANGLVTGALFAVLACAFGLVYRSARVFHIAFAGLFLVAPYIAYTANVRLGFHPYLAVICGVGGAAIAGWVSERCLYRPFFQRKASAAAVLVASLGTFIVIENISALIFGNELLTIKRGPAVRFVFGSVTFTNYQVMQFLVCAGVLSILGWAISRLPLFKAIWAMGDESTLVPVLGLPLMKYRSLVFMISGALGGLAACLISFDVGINPHMGMSYLLVAAVAVLAGGIDRYSGWVFGGVFLALIQSLVVWKFSAKWIDLVTFGVLIGVLLLRPQGILGLRKRLEEE